MFEAIASTSPELIQTLTTENMPTSDVAEPNRQFWRKVIDGVTVGFVGLEVHGDNALLRSLAVPSEFKGRGHGADLVSAAIAQAKEQGVSTVWLLTKSARPFFERIGWELADRASAPTAIAQTRQFDGLCSASATCLIKRI